MRSMPDRTLRQALPRREQQQQQQQQGRAGQHSLASQSAVCTSSMAAVTPPLPARPPARTDGPFVPLLGLGLGLGVSSLGLWPKNCALRLRICLSLVSNPAEHAVNGKVVGHLPPGEDPSDEALFHVWHDDGDDEDLDRAEVEAAAEAYTDWSRGAPRVTVRMQLTVACI